MKSKIYIIMFSCFMLKLGNVGIDKYVGQDLKPIADFINSHPRIYKGVSGFKCAKQMQ